MSLRLFLLLVYLSTYLSFLSVLPQTAGTVLPPLTKTILLLLPPTARNVVENCADAEGKVHNVATTRTICSKAPQLVPSPFSRQHPPRPCLHSLLLSPLLPLQHCIPSLPAGQPVRQPASGQASELASVRSSKGSLALRRGTVRGDPTMKSL